MAYLYVHTNEVTEKSYVGQTWQKPRRRWQNQSSHAEVGRNACPYLCAAIRKYGWGSFTHQVVAEPQTQDSLDNLEKIWIILLQSADSRFGYNLQLGGSNIGRLSDAMKKEISEYQRSHDNPGRFRAGHKPWNQNQSMVHAGSFGAGHTAYCNHRGEFKITDVCGRCGKAKADVNNN